MALFLEKTMKPEKWFLRELRLIHPRLFPVYMQKFKKWFIVGPAPRRALGVTEYDPVSGKHYRVFDIVEEDPQIKNNYALEGTGRPVPLNAKVLKALRYRRYAPIARFPLSVYLKLVDISDQMGARDAEEDLKWAQTEFWRWWSRHRTREIFS